MFAAVNAFSCACEHCHVQKFAFAVLVALLAVAVVVGKKKFNRRSSCRSRFRRRNGDFHTFCDGIYAGRHETACARCFDETYTAGTARAFTVIVCAKGRNFVSASLCRFEYGQTLFDLIRHTFDFYIYFSHSSLSLFFLDCFQAASRHTCAALDAFCGIDLSCGEFVSRGRNAR